MGENDLVENSITTKLNRMKSAFSNYNMVRMREALRYLSGPKLNLFVKIPLLIHVNQPEFPGFVPGKPEARGIYNFKNSGFCKEVLTLGEIAENQLPEDIALNSAVLGLYHIGSLGTFTQSAQSDFDYWVIIDKTRFTEQRYYNLEKKLNHIVKFSREEFDQEVTFFIMDQADIRRDCYAGFDTRETMIAPKLFLKEEFYRTFLMIAGKIPTWTLLPANLKKGGYTQLVESLSQQDALVPLFKDFIDMGKVDPPEHRDIVQGILWHICKSKEDPVKALIKSTMILSHRPGNPSQLLCDDIKQGFAKSGIDDYEVDPYKLLFDRVIEYHEAHAPEGLNLIKNAIFFRLCEYPMVRMPEPGSPKKQLLDRYIRTWNLTPFQIKKLTSYQEWPESEKRLLDKTFVKRLSQMLKEIGPTDKTVPNLDDTEKRNLKILTHKVKERLNTAYNKILESSTYLSRLSFSFFLFQKKKGKRWKLSAYAPGGSQEIDLHESRTCLGLLGWMVENRIFQRGKATIKLDVKNNLFESREEPVSVETLYLALQPVKPMSDNNFEQPAQWVKLMVLLKCRDTTQGVFAVEILAVNTWGEMYEDQLRLDTTQNLDDRYRDIAKKINHYKGETIRVFFYQLSARRDPDAVYGIKQYLTDEFLANRPGAPPSNRPLLDKL